MARRWQQIKETYLTRERLGAVAAAAVGLILVAFMVIGMVTVGRYTVDRVKEQRRARSSGPRIPISKLPGPPRTWEPPRFELNESGSQRMIGMNDSAQERWCDIAGNFYASEFARRFSYEDMSPQGPVVRIRVDEQAPTLRGRLEAKRLKPNFCYQIKLRGIFADRESFEKIGYAGRWRLPGRGTNYTDEQYKRYPEKEKVEAYLLFDYFVTDANGNASRDFALDSCLHVIWNATRQRADMNGNDLYPVIVMANDPRIYARPKPNPLIEFVWAERERSRYSKPGQTRFLPSGRYTAELVLTEESLHANTTDGGWWATVFKCPISFTIPPLETAAGEAAD